MPSDTTQTPLTREQRDELRRMADSQQAVVLISQRDDTEVVDTDALIQLLAALDAAEARVAELETERQQLRDEIARLEMGRIRKMLRDNP